jgi:phosphoribosylformylglycinamidine synthase
VSFYNEHPEGAVYPTPTIGMLGLVQDVEQHATTASFKEAGDVIFLLAPEAWAHRGDIGGSEYLAHVHDQVTGDAPYLDLDEEVAVQRAMLALIRGGHVASAHDVSEGGLAVCLAESAIFSKALGADVNLEVDDAMRLDALLFGEAQSRIVFTAPIAKADGVHAQLGEHPVQALRLGRVTEGPLRVRVNGRGIIHADRSDIAERYETAIPARMGS